jgi:hypothetical protein
MDKTLLITRPNHDETTNYFYYWSEVVIKQAERKAYSIFNLKGKKANRKTLTTYLKARNPSFVFLNGHGTANMIAGWENEPLIATNDNEELLKDKIVYIRSCECGRMLGPKLIQHGTKVFIGYNRNYMIVRIIRFTTQPLKDPLARLFLEPVNLIPTTIIKGHTAQESHLRSLQAMRRNFLKMSSSAASFEERVAAPYLWSNLKGQVLLGDPSASI